MCSIECAVLSVQCGVHYRVPSAVFSAVCSAVFNAVYITECIRLYVRVQCPMYSVESSLTAVLAN